MCGPSLPSECYPSNVSGRRDAPAAPRDQYAGSKHVGLAHGELGAVLLVIRAKAEWKRCKVKLSGTILWNGSKRKLMDLLCLALPKAQHKTRHREAQGVESCR